MAAHTVNVLLASFPGLGLPSTLSLPVDDSLSIADLRQLISRRLPHLNTRIILTTTSNREINPSNAPISSLLSSHHDAFLPLRLTVPLCGGKGGFGSQLRAAGGRMSSRKKNNQGDNNNSNRNLDGRRMRTVNEAKALAEYLALKPEMEKKEKEARRKRWEQVVALTERREEEIRNGSKGKVDGKWAEDKEEAAERAREAVIAAMKSGDYHDNLKLSPNGSSGGESGEPSEESEDEEMKAQKPKQTPTASASKPTPAPARTFLGFDNDDEFMSNDEDEEISGDEVVAIDLPVTTGKGKGKAVT